MAASQRGRFITFEGGEGSGKTTQIMRLKEWLETRGIAAVLTREPGGSSLAEDIRSLLLKPGITMDGVTQLFLFSAARRDHVETVIKPALKAGQWVLCDRFADSTRAYQGAAGMVDQQVIELCETHATNSLKPDMTFLLDVPAEVGLERANRRRGKTDKADAFESKELAFHNAVRSGFLTIANTDPKRVRQIDAARSAEVVSADITAHVEALLDEADA